MSAFNNLRHRDKSELGASVLELLLVVTIALVAATFAVIGITKVRSEAQLSSSAETLQGYMQKCVSDSKRRHALGSSRAALTVLSTTSYQVTADLNDDGQMETRTVTLPTGVTFEYTTAPVATVDMHGNVAEGSVVFTLKGMSGNRSRITISNVGDASRNETLPDMPVITATPISSDIEDTAALSGTASPMLDSSPTPDPTPLPVCTGTQTPKLNDCRCQAGKHIDPATGKCK